MAEINNNALLLFQVGPVLCCAPTLRVVAIIEPRPLTHPPGASPGQPGIFKHAGHIVTARDLRFHFGVPQQHWKTPGRVIIATLAQGSSGFLVDEITAVMAMPGTGWGRLPALIPHGIFSRTLLLNEKMYLYTDFDKLDSLREQGYLRPYLQQLLAQQEKISTRAPLAHAESATYTPLLTPPEHTLPTVPAVTATAAHTHKAAITNPVRFSTHECIKETAKPSCITDKRGAKPAATIIPTPLVILPSKTASFDVSIGKPTITPATLAHTETSINRLPSEARSPSIDLDSGSHCVWPERRKDVECRVVQPATKQHTDKIIMTPSTIQSAKPQISSLVFAVIVLALTAGMLSLFFKSTATPSSLSTHTKSGRIESGVVASQPSPDNSSIPGKVIEPMLATPASNNAAPYQATILKNNSGITIVLSAPKQEPVFAANEQVNPIPSVPTSVATTPTMALPTQTEITHIIVKGDTLWHIAKRYVHDPFRYPELARLSNINNPDLIYPGNRVRIIHQD